jgi:hypothetical protein
MTSNLFSRQHSLYPSTPRIMATHGDTGQAGQAVQEARLGGASEPVGPELLC